MEWKEVERGYANLWGRMEIRPEYRDAAKAVAKALLENRDRYQRVADVVKCPWYFVAVIHELEGGRRFNTHLHNGDPLTAKTVHVPRNRPPGKPPFTWEQSAVDALKYDGVDKITDWSVPHTLFLWEGYNGYGYFKTGINSPYLWSFSNLYTKGKYKEDGKYDAKRVSKQCGAAVILKTLQDMSE